MKKATIIVLMFVLGGVFGLLISGVIIEWFASAFSGRLFANSPTAGFSLSLFFLLGFGVLFAAAGWTGDSLRWRAIYLLTGLGISAVAAAGYRAYYASVVAELPLPGIHIAVSLDALPALRIPLMGVVGILALAFLHRWVGDRTRSERSYKADSMDHAQD